MRSQIGTYRGVLINEEGILFKKEENKNRKLMKEIKKKYVTEMINKAKYWVLAKTKKTGKRSQNLEVIYK